MIAQIATLGLPRLAHYHAMHDTTIGLPTPSMKRTQFPAGALSGKLNHHERIDKILVTLDDYISDALIR
jgi:hypothetical protein